MVGKKNNKKVIYIYIFLKWELKEYKKLQLIKKTNINIEDSKKQTIHKLINNMIFHWRLIKQTSAAFECLHCFYL